MNHICVTSKLRQDVAGQAGQTCETTQAGGAKRLGDGSWQAEGLGRRVFFVDARFF